MMSGNDISGIERLIGQIGRKVSKAAGELICRQDDHATSLYYVADGRIRCSIVDDSEEVVFLCEPGNYFGYSVLFGSTRWVTAVAVNDCTVIEIGVTAMIGALQRDVALLSHFTANLALVGRDALLNKMFALTHNLDQRVARQLLMLDLSGLNQGTIADVIGTSRETVSKALNKLRRIGAIDYNGKIEIKDREKLQAILDAPTFRRRSDDDE